ncbi:ATP-binding protein [Pseudomonas asuensis]|uniref:histidine kinase n=1 Tax=Pseudomonas asuensis TaxID=1825787 RepID=A0ABQ2GT35_9PSED|nr:ATP-binding protein [Pseudomonas asuensis]GGM11996.1 two-component sensor histidine kinase [Pseudomonas asuensis]
MIRSFRLRLLLSAALLVIICLGLMIPAIGKAFDGTVENFVAARLEANANTLIGAARAIDGRLAMPEMIAEEVFDRPQSPILGYVYDQNGRLLWRSRSAVRERPNYRPTFDGTGVKLVKTTDDEGRGFFVFDREVLLGNPPVAGFSIVTMQPAEEYDRLRSGFMHQVTLWLSGVLFALLILLAVGLHWSLRPLHRLSRQLDAIETDQRDLLDEKNVPSEISRLIRSLNRLLDFERLQRERYRDTLGDLAHSLKTPLAVLQGVTEDLRRKPSLEHEVSALQVQIERMNQQVVFQLQRATRRGAVLSRPLELQPLVESLFSTLDKVYAEKKVQSSLHFPPGMKVQAEEAAMLEVFGNLLENGYRLCLTQVQVSAQFIDDSWIIDIEDDGPGIPAERRDTVLRRGVRIDSRHPGQGIGLAVVQDILEGYRSALTIDDSSLGGARFRFRLPSVSPERPRLGHNEVRT